MNKPVFLEDEVSQTGLNARPLYSRKGYRRLHRSVVVATAIVALAPLGIMTAFNYVQYERALESETVRGINRLLTNNKRSLEFFLSERRSALKYTIRERDYSDLSNPRVLGRIILDMNESFGMGAFLDLGLVDSQGNQISYQGPHSLQGRNYREQPWFQDAAHKGTHTSDVFLGYRDSPHFSVATRHQGGNENFYVLRATFNAEMLAEHIHSGGLRDQDDIFLINHENILQTPSRRFGATLERAPIEVPAYLSDIQISEHKNNKGPPLLIGFAKISDSPFILVFLNATRHDEGSGQLVKLLAFWLVSALILFAVIIWGAGQFVNNLRKANLRRASMMHKVEYNNKLASIGRLAAGVAHEINNPLAIINEKTGLLNDLVKLQEDLPQRDKFLKITESVLLSVERCKKITHRLLGFAKHMDIRHERIDIPTLLKEVVGFLEREAEQNNIQIDIEGSNDIPSIESDRGQLQQVFLNLLNNAVGAVKSGGQIDITVDKVSDDKVSVAISDDGVGIPKENLSRIFEPFFTTKEGSGTGLGLSITYGIVKKLGGRISVESEIGEGTRFIVTLPLTRNA